MARILVVDDEPHLRFILKKQLESAGYDVLAAQDGFDALNVLGREVVDLVLLDIMMPELDGIDVVRKMKENYRTASIPVIFLTAKSSPTDKVAGLIEGANDYLTKPYEQDELLARVRNTLEWGRLQRQASPLTGLPGNQAIQDETLRRLTRGEPFAFLHIDLDSFKSFNDFYGYQRGDVVICRTAALLCETVDALATGQGFVGHIGGDDFVVMTPVDLGLPIAHALVERFDEMIPELYDAEDRARGSIRVANRQGLVENFPFVSMTIAVATDEGGRYTHIGSLGAVISELKRFGKAQRGSTVVHDRRGTEGAVNAPAESEPSDRIKPA
jgi:diguanylate cyclase (GGDEF)-like protein